MPLSIHRAYSSCGRDSRSCTMRLGERAEVDSGLEVVHHATHLHSDVLGNDDWHE